jgi:hypothetical protein
MPFAGGDEKSVSGIDLGADDPRNIVDAIKAVARPPTWQGPQERSNGLACLLSSAGLRLPRPPLFRSRF